MGFRFSAVPGIRLIRAIVALMAVVLVSGVLLALTSQIIVVE